MKDSSIIRRAIFHPFLVALFPVLSLYSHNIRQFPPDVTYRPLAAAAVIAAAAWLGIRLFVRDWSKSAVIVSLSLVLLSSYGRFGGGAPTIFKVSLASIAAAFLFIVARGVAKTRTNLAGVTAIANGVSLALVAMPLYSVAAFAVGNYQSRQADLKWPPGESGADTPTKSRAPLPNIYYIVLDGYGRDDNLSTVYGWDNSAFTGFLASRGFRVATHSRTNYSQTRQSICSSLNMAYLDGLAAAYGEKSGDTGPYKQALAHSRVREILKGQGYTFAAFSTGFNPTEVRDADIYMALPGQREEFEDGLLDATFALSTEYKVERDRARILYPFEKMPELASSRRPLLVFAHIVAPHPPFVFARDGRAADPAKYFRIASGSNLVKRGRLTRREYISLYADQLAFVNTRVEALVTKLLAGSPTPPVIIIQGDHGPGAFQKQDDPYGSYLQDRMSILNACYLPGDTASAFYDTITPVNTFRVILDRYFGTSMKILPDRSFFTPDGLPYRFCDVTDEIDGPADKARFETLRTQDYFDTP